ncbi:MAG: TraM recognition domain-containing protein [Candidatus Absconditabacterales bacterium]|nr:TraM recognition domain-containing protein [Candidatus Absconditabacterales bacterium]
MSRCQRQLDRVINQNPSVASNTSRLMSEAWGERRAECISDFGGSVTVRTYVLNRDRPASSSQQGLSSDVWRGSASTQAGSDEGLWTSMIDGMGGIFIKIVRIAVIVIVIMTLWYLGKYLFELLYDVINAHRLVFMKIVLTREDTKVDREVQKELSKDLKEKISRMTQVYQNIHKIGDLGIFDTIMNLFFKKPKLVTMLHYDDGSLSFYVATYPEYKPIVEAAIAAQYASSSIETVDRPNVFAKKYRSLVPLEPERDPYFGYKNFKAMPDDPLNNIIDAMGKVSKYDTATLQITFKPLGKEYNDRMKKLSTGLYKKAKKYTQDASIWDFFKIWKVIDFFVNGASKEMLEDDEGQDGMVRMVKAEEDAYNAMAEEASLPGYEGGVILISSSDEADNLEINLDNLITAFGVYSNEYGNKLEEPSIKKDIFGFLFLPIWQMAVTFCIPHFFFKRSLFGLYTMASFFHLPDGMYNRSPIISWMDYKPLPAPETLPLMKQENGFLMTGIIAEKYKKGKLSDILAQQQHRAIGTKQIEEESRVPIETLTADQVKDREVKEIDGKKFVKRFTPKTVYGYKMYRDGVLLGINIYRNKYSPVYFKRDDRTRHHYVIGKSGTGKSVFIQTIARQDVWNGDGLCIIDPHGDLADDMLEYIPKERAKDVIYFDAGNEDRPMGLNLYEIDHPDQADRTVNDATEIFLKMFGPEIFGPRIQEYFKYGSLTILEDFDDRPTLLDVPRLFTDETYRNFKTKKVKNAVVRNFWEKTYNAMGDREKQEIIPYFTSKFVSFNTNRLIRNIIGQTKSAIRFRQAMDTQKVILVSLSKGKIGEINAQLLGMIMVSQIYNAAMGRANMEAKDRKDFYLYVDEFQNFVSGTFADILSEARKYRLCLIMAHQYIAQLESGNKSEGGKGDVKAAVFGNCGTLMSFKVGAADAEFLEKEYAPLLGGQDIVGISNYKAYIKLNIDNSTTRVFSMNAIYTTDYRNKKIASVLKEYSSKKYGRKREFVDAEIAARLGLAISAEGGESLNGEGGESLNGDGGGGDE